MQRWGHSDVRLFLASTTSDQPRYVGAYAEVQRGWDAEVVRSLGGDAWLRVEQTKEDLMAKGFARIEEAEPAAFAQADPTTVDALQHLLDQVELARTIATKAHAGQVDKAGRPYLDHPRRVADRVVELQAQAVAWLHDVLEDTVVTAADLRQAGVDDEVIDAVVLLNRGGEDGYFARIAADTLAREAKLTDIADNTDPARTALLDPETRDRLATEYDDARRALGAQEEQR
jgi:hypothetical protein